jgi:type I restriction enzyme S subunit
MTPNDVKIVAENINDFIEVSDGINRLRKAVLTLAMSGQLVEQDKNEGTARDLYTQIQSDRKKNENIGRKKQTKELLPITDEEIPFSIPESWKWVRLGEIMTISSGDSLKVKDATEGQYLVYGGNGIAGKHSSCNARKGTIVIGRVGALCGTAHIVESDAWVTDNAFIVSYSDDFVNKDFFTLALNFLNLRSNHRGSAQPVISGISVYPILMPLPPLAEQDRIVNKVHSVMAQLNELELQKKERDAFRSRLTRSSMQALGSADSKIAFEQIIKLIKTPQDIKELESAILTLAVSGKLVPQDENEGTGADLYQKISATLIKPKKSKEIDAEDKLFNIPLSWVWTRLGDVFDVRDGTHDSPKYKDSGYPLVTSKNLYHGKLDFLNVKYVSETDHKKISERSKVDRDDILFAMIGSIGNPVIVDTDIEFSIKNVALFKYFDRKLTEPNFLLIYLKYASVNMRKVSAGGVQSFVSLGFLRQYPFPLPPLAEQKRIVAKVEELMMLINYLKSVIEVK